MRGEDKRFGLNIVTGVWRAVAGLALVLGGSDSGAGVTNGLRIGWAQTDITPERPVRIHGQFHARVSEGVMDPITATALALESPRDGTHTVMVSCDLMSIQDELRDGVRERVRDALPALDPRSVVLFGTHTHAAPVAVVSRRSQAPYENELAAMDPPAYVDWICGRIADAVIRAWENRSPGGIAYGLGQAVVGHNRLTTSSCGRSSLYGRPSRNPDFSHVEGYEDHALHVLATYDTKGRPTGLVLNIACPAQVSEGIYQISADFWHDTRMELRRRLGDELFILPQCGAAGDQSPHVLVHHAAEDRMQRLSGRTRRQEIAVRIADGVTAVLPFFDGNISMDAPLAHLAEKIELPWRPVLERDRDRAAVKAVEERAKHDAIWHRLEAEPENRKGRWYHDVSRAYAMFNRHERVVERFELQQSCPTFGVEIHAVRLGEVAFVFNPFELYLDYGLQIQAHSRAVQTFVVQLAGPASYLPTERAIAGGAYGAEPASTKTGPEGGKILVQRSAETINALWDEE